MKKDEAMAILGKGLAFYQKSLIFTLIAPVVGVLSAILAFLWAEYDLSFSWNIARTITLLAYESDGFSYGAVAVISSLAIAIVILLFSCFCLLKAAKGQIRFLIASFSLYALDFIYGLFLLLPMQGSVSLTTYIIALVFHLIAFVPYIASFVIFRRLKKKEKELNEEILLTLKEEAK